MLRVFLGVMICTFVCLACSPPSRHACRTLDTSTHFLAEYLATISTELEKTQDPELALHNIQTYMENSKDDVHICTEFINNTHKGMTNAQVLQHHEAYISDPRVKRFLDAQDLFHEKATPEQIETLDELLNPLFLLSE